MIYQQVINRVLVNDNKPSGELSTYQQPLLLLLKYYINLYSN